MMRPAALAAVVAVALASGAAAPGSGEPLYALVDAQGRAYVAQLDPDTLRPLPGRSVQIGVSGPGSVPAWSFDQGRRRIAVAIGQRLRIVDLARMRVVGTARLGLDTAQRGVLWRAPERVVVIQTFGADFRTTVVDTRRLRVVSRTRIAGGAVVDSEETPTGLALLLAPSYEIGPARLLLIDGDGRHRHVAIERVLAGMVLHDDAAHSSEQVRPGLAVDAGRGAAYVVTPDGMLAEVELRSAALRYHSLRGRYAKLMTGASRDAFVLRGRIVVTGDSSSATTAPDGTTTVTSVPSGLEVVDPSTWEVKRLAATASEAVAWRDAVVTTGSTWSSATGHVGMGVAVHDLDGATLRRVLQGKRAWLAAVHHDRLYAFVDGERELAVVDLATGQVERRRQVLPWLLLGRSSSTR